MTNLQTPLQIYPSMCAKQLEDLDQILQAIDDFGASTLAIGTQGPMGYTVFIQSRDELRNLVKETAKKYRLVV